MPDRQTDALRRMREVLHDDYRAITVESFRLEENFAEEQATILGKVRVDPENRAVGIEGVGNGLIDAVFNGLQTRFAYEFPSLTNIQFTTFVARGLLKNASGHAADADAEVEAGITNSYGTEFRFKARASSLSRASVQAVVSAVEYFVNAEAAYVTTWRALQHYREAGRNDLVGKYTELLAELVRNTSYSEVIERLKADSGR